MKRCAESQMCHFGSVSLISQAGFKKEHLENNASLRQRLNDFLSEHENLLDIQKLRKIKIHYNEVDFVYLQAFATLTTIHII